jgi:hypothetical protein
MGPERKVTFQNAASATANGTVMNLTGLSYVALQISGSFVATVTFEATIDGSTWVAVEALNASGGSVGTTATEAGIYVSNVAGYRQFRARLTWGSGTSCTVTGIGVDSACAAAPTKFWFYPPIAPAELVVAGAASVLGKIVTIPIAASGVSNTIFVRCPAGAGVGRILWSVFADNAFTVTKYRSNAAAPVNAPTVTLASVQANDTVIINGLTFTAHANTTVEATGQFSIGGDDTADAAELVKCINTRFAALGITATSALGVVTLAATTATTTQCVTGVGGARIVCAQTLPLLLDLDPQGIDGNPIVNTTTTGSSAYKGQLVEQYIDGWAHGYLGIANNGADAMVLAVGATRLGL